MLMPPANPSDRSACTARRPDRIHPSCSCSAAPINPAYRVVHNIRVWVQLQWSPCESLPMVLHQSGSNRLSPRVLAHAHRIRLAVTSCRWIKAVSEVVVESSSRRESAYTTAISPVPTFLLRLGSDRAASRCAVRRTEPRMRVLA